METYRRGDRNGGFLGWTDVIETIQKQKRNTIKYI
jgi:hypothetical protein